MYIALPDGDIHGEVYDEWDGVCYKLTKSLFGLKQAPRLWYERLWKILKDLGLTQLESCNGNIGFRTTYLSVSYLFMSMT